MLQSAQAISEAVAQQAQIGNSVYEHAKQITQNSLDGAQAAKQIFFLADDAVAAMNTLLSASTAFQTNSMNTLVPADVRADTTSEGSKEIPKSSLS
jgi:hypothetical protein